MDLPLIDLDVFLSGPRDSIAVIQECKKVGISSSDSIHVYRSPINIILSCN